MTEKFGDQSLLVSSDDELLLTIGSFCYNKDAIKRLCTFKLKTLTPERAICEIKQLNDLRINYRNSKRDYWLEHRSFAKIFLTFYQSHIQDINLLSQEYLDALIYLVEKCETTLKQN